MNKKLIVLDLDGTLLYDWQTVTKTSISYLLELKKEGHKIVIATGRPLRSSISFYNALQLDTPIVNYNGSLITNPADKAFATIQSTFNKEYVFDIVKNNKEYIDNAFSEIHDDIYLYKEDDGINPLLHLQEDTKVYTGDFTTTLKENPHGFILVSKEGKGKFIESYIQSTFDGKLLCRNWGNEYKDIIEVYTPKTNKGIAITNVANSLCFSLDDVIAFGDALNDIELLQTAGIGIAMKNSREELLPYADQITDLTNTEDGVIQHLKKIFN